MRHGRAESLPTWQRYDTRMPFREVVTDIFSVDWGLALLGVER